MPSRDDMQKLVVEVAELGNEAAKSADALRELVKVLDVSLTAIFKRFNPGPILGPVLYESDDGTALLLTIARRKEATGLALEWGYPDDTSGFKEWLVNASLDEVRLAVEKMPELLKKLREEMHRSIKLNAEAAAQAKALVEALSRPKSQGG